MPATPVSARGHGCGPISGWEGPGHAAPDHVPATLSGSLSVRGHSHHVAQVQSSAETRTGRGPAGASTRAPLASTASGQKTEEPGPLLSPAPGPDDTDAHTCTHTQCACVGLAVLTQTSQPERRLERQEAFKPQPAHSGHHSPRRRCYKTWCGVCGSGGRACGSGTAPSPVTAGDDGNVKTHSSPLQTRGSALHTGMCRCHGAPGISSGRAGGRGCREGGETPVRWGPSSHQPRFRFWAKGVW